GKPAGIMVTPGSHRGEVRNDSRVLDENRAEMRGRVTAACFWSTHDRLQSALPATVMAMAVSRVMTFLLRTRRPGQPLRFDHIRDGVSLTWVSLRRGPALPREYFRRRR